MGWLETLVVFDFLKLQGNLLISQAGAIQGWLEQNELNKFIEYNFFLEIHETCGCKRNLKLQ